jgi:hypothetical protein
MSARIFDPLAHELGSLQIDFQDCDKRALFCQRYGDPVPDAGPSTSGDNRNLSIKSAHLPFVIPSAGLCRIDRACLNHDPA